jgi:hypothetical protein
MQVFMPSGAAMTVYLLHHLKKKIGCYFAGSYGPHVTPLSVDERTLTLMTPLSHAEKWRD